MATATVDKPSNLKQINCPRCNSSSIIKNGRRGVRQRYKCKDCNRHFLEYYIQQGDRSIVSKKSTVEPNKRRIPDKALILLTSHRSGSTWLSDALRCHPAIEYYSTAILYEELGLQGRRYPGDLSNQADCTYELEVQPGKLDKIPKFDIAQDLEPKLRKLQFEPYAVEKCHPSFFDFNPELFLQKIEHLESLGIEVKLVYLVRDPKSLMTSFMNYQQRKPTWYKNIVGEKLIDFITNTYRCIGRVSKKRSGLMLDYSDTRTDMPQALLKIYKMLWSNLTKPQEECLLSISKLALKNTNREQRVTTTNSPFLGKQEGNIRGGEKKYQDFFINYEELIKQCYVCYEGVI